MRNKLKNNWKTHGKTKSGSLRQFHVFNLVPAISFGDSTTSVLWREEIWCMGNCPTFRLSCPGLCRDPRADPWGFAKLTTAITSIIQKPHCVAEFIRRVTHCRLLQDYIHSVMTKFISILNVQRDWLAILLHRFYIGIIQRY